jgi:hypothetical protein
LVQIEAQPAKTIRELVNEAASAILHDDLLVTVLGILDQ